MRKVAKNQNWQQWRYYKVSKDLEAGDLAAQSFFKFNQTIKRYDDLKPPISSN